MDKLDASLARIIIFGIFCVIWSFMLPIPAKGQTQVMNGVDDGTAHIQLGHTFPYYGGVFTDAWMSSNGFILLYDPVNQFGNSNTWNNGCCSGFNPSGQGRFSYMLAPLWTDLRHNTSIPDSGYFYETGTDGTAFLWKNITEYGTNNLNTFGVQLWPDGSFDFHYADVNITRHSTWIGFTGDTTYVNPQNVYEEVNEVFYKTGSLNMDDVASFASVVNETDNGTYAAWYGQDGGYESNQVFGPDCSDPLNDTSCPGYEEAYFDQQCSADALYDSQCPGYEQAYFDQQCSADPLYDQQCPGYEQAYYDQQCSISPLYDSQCPGYAQAYYDQQCTLDALYDTGCPGYEQAYFDQQCGLDALYDSNCPGYQEALAIQDAAGTDFIFGDDISDFYDTNPTDETDMFLSNENETDIFAEPEIYDEPIEETLYNEEDLYSQTIQNNDFLNTEPEVFDLEEDVVTVEADPIEELEALATIEEETTLIEDEMSNLEEELLAVEEVAEVEVEAEVEEAASTSTAKVDVVAIAQKAIDETKALEESVSNTLTETQSNLSDALTQDNVSSMTQLSDNASQQEQVFASEDAFFESATIAVAIDPTITVITEQSQQDEQTQDLQMDSSTPQMDTGFSSQQDQSFSTGQSITAVLNNVAPNFSKFDVSPPSQQEQKQTAKAETAAKNMSEEQLNESMENLTDEMQDSGGFSDQSLTMFLMGRVNGFDSYNTKLPDGEMYIDKGMPGGRVQNDRRNMMMLIGTSGKHEQMIAEQYK